MSYCRFENTNNALMDCEEKLREFLSGDGDHSDPTDAKIDERYELGAAVQLILRCKRIAKMFREELDAPDDELTEPAILDALQNCNAKYDALAAEPENEDALEYRGAL